MNVSSAQCQSDFHHLTLITLSCLTHHIPNPRLELTITLRRACHVDRLDIALRAAYQGRYQFSNPRVVEAHPKTGSDLLCRRPARPRGFPRRTLSASLPQSADRAGRFRPAVRRSEEHTSELQSLR